MTRLLLVLSLAVLCSAPADAGFIFNRTPKKARAVKTAPACTTCQPTAVAAPVTHPAPGPIASPAPTGRCPLRREVSQPVVARPPHPPLDPAPLERFVTAGLFAVDFGRRSGLPTRAADFDDLRQSIWLRVVQAVRTHSADSTHPLEAVVHCEAVRAALDYFDGPRRRRHAAAGFRVVTDNCMTEDDLKAVGLIESPDHAPAVRSAIDHPEFLTRWLDRLTPKERAAVSDRWDLQTGETTATVGQVAARHGVTRDAIKVRLRKAAKVAREVLGDDAPKPKPGGRTGVTLPPGHAADMLARVTAGESLGAVGRSYGVSHWRVRDILTKLGRHLAPGAVPPPRGAIARSVPVPPAIVERVRAAAAGGAGLRALGREYGLSYKVVRRIVRKEKA